MGMRKSPFPVASPPAPTARRVGRTFAIGERRRPHTTTRSSAGPLGAERQSQPEKLDKCSPGGKGESAAVNLKVRPGCNQPVENAQSKSPHGLIWRFTRE